MKLEVGSAYCHNMWNECEIDFAVVRIEHGTTMRFKIPTIAIGWRLFVLAVRGDCPWDIHSGDNFFVPLKAAITQNVRRIS